MGRLASPYCVFSSRPLFTREAYIDCVDNLITECSPHIYNYHMLLKQLNDGGGGGAEGFRTFLIRFGPSFFCLPVLPNPFDDTQAVLAHLKRTIFEDWTLREARPPNHDERTAVPIFDFRDQEYTYLGNFPDA